jgi:hypothetical protein
MYLLHIHQAILNLKLTTMACGSLLPNRRNTMGKFLMLSNSTEVKDVLIEHKSYTSIILFKSVQSGKTSDVLKTVSHFYKESAIVFISDKNTCLASQTNSRARSLGFEIVNYRDDIRLGKFLKESVGKKRIIHLLMEINNLKQLEDILDMLEDLPVTVVIDEADKSRNTIEANERKQSKKKNIESDDEDTLDEEPVADGSSLPPVTMLLLQIKNMVKSRSNSRTIFVSATPAAILTAEKDDWLVLYKQPYQNYVGIGIDHPANIVLDGRIVENRCKARNRWTGDYMDQAYNSFYPAVSFATEQFVKAANKQEEGSDIVQLCLISLENRKIQQFGMAEVIKRHLNELGASNKVGLFVMNSETKESSEETLADLIKQQKDLGFRKVIIIAGFMASRGVSFTDYSDKENQFEIIIQVHYTKKFFPLNSSLQNMRVSGPARRTVGRPVLICNHWCAEDMKVNFLESYRIIKEIAETNCATLGMYNSSRPLTQPYNFRYLKQGHRTGYGQFVFPSVNEADSLPIVP